MLDDQSMLNRWTTKGTKGTARSTKDSPPVFVLRSHPNRLIQPHEDNRLDIQRVALDHNSECITECAKP